MKYVDQDGKAIDAFWDAANVGYDFGSFSKNTFESAYNSAGMLWNSYVTGDYNKAAEYANNYDRQVSEAKDAAIDFGLDAGAAAIPFVPAGIRKVDKGADGFRIVGRAGKNKSIWTTGKYGDSVKNAYEHYKNHGKDFPDVQNAVQYVKKAKNFFRNQTGYETIIDRNGVKRAYDLKTNTFGSYSSNGTPKTFMKPNSSSYWASQIQNTTKFNIQKLIK